MVNMSCGSPLRRCAITPTVGSHEGIPRPCEVVRKMDKPHYCLWWIPDGHIPTLPRPRAVGTLPNAWRNPYSFWSRRSSSADGSRLRVAFDGSPNRAVEAHPHRTPFSKTRRNADRTSSLPCARGLGKTDGFSEVEGQGRCGTPCWTLRCVEFPSAATATWPKVQELTHPLIWRPSSTA